MLTAWVRLSAASKSMIATFLVVGVTGLIQWILVARGVASGIAIAVPLVASPVISWAYTVYFVRYRTRALTTAFSSMADGNLDTQLPPAPDVEMVPVRAAFDRMGESLRDMTARLRQADSQRRRLFADLIHELATPTSTVLAIGEALATPALSSTEEARTWLIASLDHEANRLLGLIGDMRDLANLDDPAFTLTPEPTDIGMLGVRTAERLNLLGKGDRPIHCQIEEAPALADPARIEQVLINVLSNAQRYTPREGVVELVIARAGRSVQIVVEDSGPGVAEELLPRLGERLFRADASRSRRSGGHGLGLSITTAIVQRHHGTIAFERGRHGGLRVVIALPAVTGVMDTTGDAAEGRAAADLEPAELHRAVLLSRR